MDNRRVRTRLSIGETDATWLYTATNQLFRFKDGFWHQSVNVYYGADAGWRSFCGEPITCLPTEVFIEMLPNQHYADAEFIKIIQGITDKAQGIARMSDA